MFEKLAQESLTHSWLMAEVKIHEQYHSTIGCLFHYMVIDATLVSKLGGGEHLQRKKLTLKHTGPGSGCKVPSSLQGLFGPMDSPIASSHPLGS